MSEPAFRFCDELGPQRILHLYQPTLGMRAIAKDLDLERVCFREVPVDVA